MCSNALCAPKFVRVFAQKELLLIGRSQSLGLVKQVVNGLFRILSSQHSTIVSSIKDTARHFKLYAPLWPAQVAAKHVVLLGVLGLR